MRFLEGGRPMKRLIVVFLTAAMIPALVLGTRLERIDHWKHEQTYWGPISGSFLDSAGDLILMFRKSGPVAVSHDKTAAIAPFGQSPDEATQVFTVCEYRGDLALFEDVNKIKIFRRTGKTYHGEKTIWLKRDPFLFLLKTALFVNGRFFLAGVKILNGPVSAEKVDIANLHVIEEDSSSPGRSIILERGIKFDRRYEIERFLIPYGNDVLYIKQSEPRILFISQKTLGVEKTLELKVPDFYKSLPRDFYALKNYQGSLSAYLLDLDTWAKSYSAITKAVLYEKNFVLIQMRTCRESPGRFALLLYDLEKDGSPEEIVYMDDLLLAERDGRLYCYQNGNPDLDEEADETAINIYKLIKK